MPARYRAGGRTTVRRSSLPLAPGPVSPGVFHRRKHEKVTIMAKRSKAQARRTLDDNVELLHPIQNGWDPLQSDERDRKYVRHVRPQSANQQALMTAIREHNLTIAVGPAGTGKTYLAIAAAVEALDRGDVGRIILSRPAIEAGESLGYLPGSMEDKLLPYLRPLYDALSERLGTKRLKGYIADSTIEIAPVAYMRGRTFNNAFIVIDEAQNCTYGQIKMSLTRLGWHSTMVVTGDPDQTDLLPEMSGLRQIADRLAPIDDIAVIQLEQQDVVRHPLVASMLDVL